MDQQQSAPKKYTFMGQFTQLTNKISMASFLKDKCKDNTITGDNFRSGSWNIWLYKRGKHVKEVVLMHCGEDISKNQEAIEYDDNKYFWGKPMHMRGSVYIVTDESKMRINTNEIVDMGDIGKLENGLIIKNRSKKIKYSDVRVTAKNGAMTGIKITYR